MALQEWFNYFKEDGDLEEVFNTINKAKNSDLKFYYDCLIEGLRRQMLTDKIVICFDIDDEESAKRSILPESMIKHKEITGCSWNTLLNFCSCILDNAGGITRVCVPYTKNDEECECYIYGRNKNIIIDELYNMINFKKLRDTILRDASEAEGFVTYIKSNSNIAGEQIFNLILENFMLIDCCGVFNTLNEIKRSRVKKWENLVSSYENNDENIDNKIIIQFLTDILDEIIDFMFRPGKEIILDINKGIADVNNSPIKFYLLSKEIFLYNQEIKDKSEHIDYIKIASKLIDYAIRREDSGDTIEVIKTEENITYRNKILSDLVEMARKDKVELFYTEDNIDATIEYSTIPESFREHLRETDSTFEDMQYFCDEILPNEQNVRFINLSDAKTEDMDPYYTYTTNEKNLIHNMNNSIIVNKLIENIEKYKETRPFKNQNDYRECEKQITPTVDAIYTHSPYDDEQELWENYKDLIIKYHVYNMKNDITKAARKFKDHMMVLPLLGVDQRVNFYLTICDTVIDFFKKESSLTLYTDGRNLDVIKLPMGIYLFLDDFKQNLKFIRGIVDFAIDRAGIQDLFEITETKDYITYKNKLIQ